MPPAKNYCGIPGQAKIEIFLQGRGARRKYHLVKWDTICKSKVKGGLGIKDISKMNISLLCKWWWRPEKENRLWQELIKKKYLKDKPICLVKHRLDDSPMWSDLLKIRQVYLGVDIFKSWMERQPFYGRTHGYVINLCAPLTQFCMNGVVIKTSQFMR